MKNTTAVLLVLALAGTARAGEVYGKILEGSAPVGEGVAVAAKCAAKSYPAVKTDKNGSYHLLLDSGKCALNVTYKQQTVGVDIASYDEPAQVDVVLEIKDGKLTARRK
ncbi:MAG TPA: hypothetical protein VJS92_17555 [Candidatus Polarisedimenticolaceae bacterium]|nr:hypothetical protein [Candidatus Polarisedimenticolaceae bacterium]